MANWYKMLEEAMSSDKESISNMICTLTEEELKEEFNAGFGGTEGKSFTAWGKNWVYFPICYDGAEWVGQAPRHPCDISMNHQGGG